MPFTPSHAVLALPFVRTPLVPAAIAVGAMAPDLPLFVRVIVPSYDTTHALRWLPVTIVIALGLLIVWRCVLRPAARELAPEWVARRLPDAWDGGAGEGVRETFGVARGRVSVRAIALLVLSLGVGVITHVVWDAFTHEGRWGVALLPALDEQWGPVTGLKWLQHSSSALGLLVIAVWGAVWLSRRRPSRPSRVLPSVVRALWWVSLPAALLVAWGIGLVTLGPLDAQFTPAHLAYRVLPPACATWGAATLALAVLVQVLRARTRRSAGSR